MRVLSICPTSVTDGGAYARIVKDAAANGDNSAQCVPSTILLCIARGVRPSVRRCAEAAAVPPHVFYFRSALAWLYEVPLAGVVRGVLAQLRWGAPSALVPLTLLPVRLLAVLQQLAPDWMTAALVNPRLKLFTQGGRRQPATNGAELKKSAATISAAARKEE